VTQIEAGAFFLPRWMCGALIVLADIFCYPIIKNHERKQRRRAQRQSLRGWISMFAFQDLYIKHQLQTRLAASLPRAMFYTFIRQQQESMCLFVSANIAGYILCCCLNGRGAFCLSVAQL